MRSVTARKLGLSAAVTVAAAGAIGGGVAAAGGTRPSEPKRDLVRGALGPTPTPAARARARAAALRLGRPPARSTLAPSARVATPTARGGVPVPVPPSVLHVTNLWQTQRHGSLVSVYAGSSARNAARGELVVVTSNPTAGTVDRAVYPTPGRSGALRLTRVTGDHVHYTTTRGSQGTFDLADRGYAP